MWEIRQFGEKVEKQQQLAKQKAVEAAQRENSEKIKKQMEEQLKKQREAHHAKRLAEAAAKAAATPTTASTATMGTPTTAKFTSIIQNRGMKRIFTSRGTTPVTSTTTVTPRVAAPNSYATVRTPAGQTFRIPLSVLQGKSPGQQIIIRSATAVTTPQTTVTLPTITNQTITRTPTPTTTYIVRTPTGPTTLRPIILSNQVRPTLTQQTVQQPAPQPQVLQRHVQVPIRFPDGRMQVLQIPLSAIAGNQPIQIAINTQPTATTANVLSNSIQIVSTANGGAAAIVSNPQPIQTQTPQIRIITNNNTNAGQPVVTKLVQMRPQQQTVQAIQHTQPQTQQIQIQAPQQQLNQILAQQLQAGKIQVKINASPNVTTIQTPQRPSLPQQPIVRAQTPIVATVRIEPKAQQKVIPIPTQTSPPETPNNVTLKAKSPVNAVVNNDKTPQIQATTQTPSTTPQLTPQQFVLTSEITQEIVRKALMNPNVAPEIQQKLMALQRHHQEQKDPIKSKPVAPPVTPVVNTKSRSGSGSRSGSRPSKAKQTQMSSEQKEETSIMAACQAVVKSLLDKIEKEVKPKGSNKKQKVKETAEERRHRQNSSKLQVLLYKHTELLKKDIAKRRALLEKNLKIEVQNELSAVLTKQNSPVKSPNKRATNSHAVISSPKKPNTGVKRKANNVNNNLVIDEDFDDSDEIRPPKQKKSRLNSSPSSASPKKVRSPASNQSKGMKNMKNMKANALYCICRKPYDGSRCMVGCDVCSNWFHVDCVGLTEAQAKKAEQYLCPNCDKLRAKNNELYCLCRQPYDESQFYICCDQCQDWFHGRCVGVLQSEADSIDEYVCPNCQSDSQINFANLKKLETKDFDNMKKLLKTIQVFINFLNFLMILKYSLLSIFEFLSYLLIQAHKNSWPFLEPVNSKEVPDYHKVIKEPMG